MQRIVVLGASGQTGAQVVAQGLARGYEVTAFVRDPSKAASKLPKGALVVQGDGLSASQVAIAVAGHDAVVVAVGDRRTLVSGPIIRNVIAGMKAANMRRVILLSAYGAGDSGHGFQGFMFRTALRKLNADKMAAEQALTDSGLDWTAVRAVALSNKPATGRVRTALDGKVSGFRPISRADLATFMLDEIDRRAFVRKRPILYAA
ncbi:MAG: NAD(P)H-binding protein [Bauldia sp.]|nr:NAD(P)H-binding protein [Bauldia sp.]